MSEIAESIRSQINQLTAVERAELAYLLLESLDAAETQQDVDNEWEKELGRRWNQLEQDQVVGIPMKQVFDKLRRKHS